MTAMTMTLDEYVSECKRLFGEARYGWSDWEQESAVSAWEDRQPAEDAVHRMNEQWVRRRADRNV